MSKTLVIAEKPSVARDIAGALPDTFKKEEGFLEGKDYVITWAVGHLVTLKEPEDYDPKFKRWYRKHLPILPEKFGLKAIDSRGKAQLKIIHKQLKRKDITNIVNACDAGREGELIFRYVYETAKVKTPHQRLWISSMTKKSILDGFANLKTSAEMEPLADAARSRSEADWLVGMNATRAATLQARAALGGVVSLGRVQTPTLKLIVDRELEIEKFVPETYWNLTADFTFADGRSYKGLWFDTSLKKSDKKRHWLDGVKAKKLATDLKNVSGEITNITVKDSTEQPALLYDLTSLQRDANNKLGWSAKRTLGIAQALYEKHKVLTYPRTSSRYLTTDMEADLKDRAKLLGGLSEYKQASDYVSKLTKLPVDRVVNDAKVSDHHAIIPTEVLADFSKLQDDEKKLYDLVAKRFLAIFHPDAKWESTTLVTTVKDESFHTKGRVLKVAGWRSVYGEIANAAKASEDINNQTLPKLAEGEKPDTNDTLAEEKQTKPPGRYSDAGLLGMMETAGKLIDDEELREAMKEGGLGTPATRAQTIELLINRGYVMRDGKALKALPAGMKVIELLAKSKLASPELTGGWEKTLLEIEKGKAKRADFMNGIKDFTQTTVDEILAIDKATIQVERAEVGACPKCKAKGVDSIIRENSRAYGCSSWSRDDPGCGFVIWKRVAGRPILPHDAEELIANGKTEKELGGFKSKKGKTFRARLKLNEEYKVEFDFPEAVAATAQAEPPADKTEETA